MIGKIRTCFGSIGKYIIFAVFCFAVVACVSAVSVSADDDDANWPHYPGKATNRVNVRSGPGEEYNKLTDSNNDYIQLLPQEEVTIIDEAKATTGTVWYKITFERNGETYTGFSTSSYIAKDDENPITPSPTPTPTVTPTPTPAPTAAPTNTPAPTNSLIKPDDGSQSNSKDSIMKAIKIVIIVAVLALAGLITFKILRDRKKSNGNATSRKVDKLKKMNINGQNNGRKTPQIKKLESENVIAEEVRQDIYYKSTYRYDDQPAGNSQEAEEKKALRAAIDHLQEHDIVYHVIYGEGEVYDNSDVKLLEVRFGNDMRFLKKEQLVARRELKIIDEEEQAISRRKRRKKT